MHYRYISQFLEVIFHLASLKGCASQVPESEFKELEDGETWSTLIYRKNTSFLLALRDEKFGMCKFVYANLCDLH